MGTTATVPAGSPVTYPSITVGGKSHQLRFAHGAWFQIQQWGYRVGDPDNPIPIAVLAAAAMGEEDGAGNWHTVGFKRPLDMLDRMITGETLASFDQPVLEALGKAVPGANLTTLEPPPADTEPAS